MGVIQELSAIDYADKITIQRIETAHPLIKEELYKIYLGILRAGVSVRFTSVFRSLGLQGDLYKKYKNGGPLAAKPGLSFHNYGLAVDFCLLIDGRAVSWDTSADLDGDGVSDWGEVVKVFKAHGWTWGGDWRRKDKPHFQKDLGYKIRTLKSMSERGQALENGYLELRDPEEKKKREEALKAAKAEAKAPKINTAHYNPNQAPQIKPKREGMDKSVICPKCSRVVELDGPGSTSNLFNKGVSKVLNFIYPKTQRLFKPASDIHDLDYHLGPQPGEIGEEARLDRDNTFLKNCKKAIRAGGLNFLMKRWHFYQAEKYYLALRLGGSAAWPKQDCKHSARVEEEIK